MAEETQSSSPIETPAPEAVTEHSAADPVDKIAEIPSEVQWWKKTSFYL